MGQIPAFLPFHLHLQNSFCILLDGRIRFAYCPITFNPKIQPMKKFVTVSLLAISSFIFSSCNKNVSEDVLAVVPEPKLEAAIYPVITKPTIMAMGTEQSICNVGDNISLFLPYVIVSDDIQEASLSVRDAITGETLAEMPLSFSTDLSVLNITVPEELQGQTFLFANMNLGTEFSGRKVTVSTIIKATSLRATDTMENAFQIQ